MLSDRIKQLSSYAMVGNITVEISYSKNAVSLNEFNINRPRGEHGCLTGCFIGCWRDFNSG